MFFSKSSHGGWDTKLVFGLLICILMTAYHEVENVDIQPWKLLVSLDVFQKEKYEKGRLWNWFRMFFLGLSYSSVCPVREKWDMISWTGASVAQVVYLYSLENSINSFIKSAWCIWKCGKLSAFWVLLLCMPGISISRALIRGKMKLRYSHNSDERLYSRKSCVSLYAIIKI